MPIHKEMRLLSNRWSRPTDWPKWLDWIEIHGLRGWTGQRLRLTYPIMAIVGENGAGKSTILQSIASAFKGARPDKNWYPSVFFPSTAWESPENVTIRYHVRERERNTEHSIRKLTERWRGIPNRPERNVEYLDLRRLIPLHAKVGYSRIAKIQYRERARQLFDQDKLTRFNQIMGRQYDFAGDALTTADEKRHIQITSYKSNVYSGYHGGAGETILEDFLKTDIPENSIVLIDEIETSLHPRTQRRFIRDLATLCRTKGLQVVVTTHSPYVLGELPLEARVYVFEGTNGKEILPGISPDFAMTQMDDESYPECDIYVEDARAEMLLREIAVRYGTSLVSRCQFIRYGAASVGQHLGIMKASNSFPRPSLIYLDGDQELSNGCLRLVGEDAPERVVFAGLRNLDWREVANRTGRRHSQVVDASHQAMAIHDHHEWVGYVADKVLLPSDVLWQVFCSIWADSCVDDGQQRAMLEPIRDVLGSK